MSNNYFRFKQFTIHQEGCAMKVGVDGALLGAWTRAGGCRKILDVGTGAGLIALMLAQRNPEATVDALDIDESACEQARANAEASPFAGRIRVIHVAFADYAAGVAAYDLIVSNPPYFVRSLPSPDPRRCLARHAGSLSLEELISAAGRLLTATGKLSLILPAGREEELKSLAACHGLHPSRQTLVAPLAGGAVKRVLSELSVAPVPFCEQDSLCIEEIGGRYSPAFISLLKDYYLYL
ncbi:MAG: methyltransferase [Tannerellaceae bacterium]|jgi:tRNA1Val (adenine37-N6)-methyltransferase|nr:methyltransferase [Tannerellaceae bacterium]